MVTVPHHAHGTPCWFDLATSDVDAACRFYSAVFQWRFESGPPALVASTRAFLGDRAAAGISPVAPETPRMPTWNVYFAVQNAEASARKIRANGGRVLLEPTDVGDGGRAAFAIDSAGITFGIWEPKGHTGAAVAGEPGSMIWCEANTRNASKAGVFYTTVFGLEPRLVEHMRTPYFMLYMDGAAVAGILQMTRAFGDVPPHWMAYFAVEDPVLTSQAAEAAGGVVRVPTLETPWGHMAVIQDPQGAVFALLKPPA